MKMNPNEVNRIYNAILKEARENGGDHVDLVRKCREVGMTYADIGSRMGMTASGVHQLLNRGRPMRPIATPRRPSLG